MYCTTHDVKVPFFMPEFYISNIIDHRFHFDNNKGKLVICYEMIIVRDLMVQLGLSAYLKRQVLQWYGVTVPINNPVL